MKNFFGKILILFCFFILYSSPALYALELYKVSSDTNAVVIDTAVPAGVGKIVLLPTAYSKKGGGGVYLNFDYYIGGLYGRHKESGTSLFYRVGALLLSLDIKNTFQRESKGDFFSSSLGVLVNYLYTGNTGSETDVGVTVGKEALKMSNPYFVLGKRWKKISLHFGGVLGGMGRIFPYLSDYLHEDRSGYELFYCGVSMNYKWMPLKMEIMKPNGSQQNVWFLQTHIGKELYTNFQIAYLHYDGGYDVLGFFNIPVDILSW